MGKSLIIKGADFSENGMHYSIARSVWTKVYYKGTGQGSLVEMTSSDWPVAYEDGRYYYNPNHDDSYVLYFNKANTCVSNKVPVEDYTHVSVRTLIEAQSGDYVLLACIDASGKMLGGFCTTSGSTETFLTKVGIAEGWREYEMDIPEGTTHVIATYQAESTSPFVDNGFNITLSKFVL